MLHALRDPGSQPQPGIADAHQQRAKLAIMGLRKNQSLRNAFICKTGRFAKPAGKPILTLNAHPSVLLYMRFFLAAKGNF